MKPSLMIFIISLLMPILSYSQSGYPKQIVLEKDSVVAITLSQMKTLNLLKTTSDENKELLSEQENKTKKLESVLKSTEEWAQKLEEKDKLNLLELENRQQLIAAQAKSINDLTKSIKRDKVKKGLLIGVIGAVATTLIILK